MASSTFDRFVLYAVGLAMAVAAAFAVAGFLTSMGVLPAGPPEPPPISPEACVNQRGALRTTKDKHPKVTCYLPNGEKRKVFIDGGRKP